MDIRHRNEFATLKAMDEHGYFIHVVFASTFFLLFWGLFPVISCLLVYIIWPNPKCLCPCL